MREHGATLRRKPRTDFGDGEGHHGLGRSLDAVPIQALLTATVQNFRKFARHCPVGPVPSPSHAPTMSGNRPSPSRGRLGPARRPAHRPARRLDRRALAGLLIALWIIGAALRGLLVGRDGVWADEAFSLAMATGHSLEHPAALADPAQRDYLEPAGPVPPAALRRYLEHDDLGDARHVVRAVLLSDTNPPAYYVLLYVWTRGLGTSDAALRLFSVLWAMLTVPLLWSLACQVGGRRAGLLACALFLAAPLGLFYSTEGRMYSLVWFLVAANAWVVLRLRYGRHVGRLTMLWVLIGAAGLLTHYLFSLVWAAGAGWLLLHPRRVSRRAVIGGAALTFLLVLPWYVLAIVAAPSWRVTQNWTLMPSWNGWFVDLVDLLLSYFSAHGSWGGPSWSRRVAAGTAVLLAALFGWTLRGRLFTTRRQLLWLWLIAALAGPLASDVLRGTYSAAQVRYAVAGFPAFTLLLGLLVSRLRPPLALGVLLLLLVPWAYGNRAIVNGRAPWEPLRGVAQQLDAQARPGDLIILHSIPSGIAGVARYMQSETPALSWVGQLRQRRVPEDVQAFADEYRRVVLVVIHEVGEPVPEETWLRAHARMIEEVPMGSGRIVYFAPLHGGRFDTARVSGDAIRSVADVVGVPTEVPASEASE